MTLYPTTITSAAWRYRCPTNVSFSRVCSQELFGNCATTPAARILSEMLVLTTGSSSLRIATDLVHCDFQRYHAYEAKFPVSFSPWTAGRECFSSSLVGCYQLQFFFLPMITQPSTSSALLSHKGAVLATFPHQSDMQNVSKISIKFRTDMPPLKVARRISFGSVSIQYSRYFKWSSNPTGIFPKGRKKHSTQVGLYWNLVPNLDLKGLVEIIFFR